MVIKHGIGGIQFSYGTFYVINHRFSVFGVWATLKVLTQNNVNQCGDVTDVHLTVSVDIGTTHHILGCGAT